MKLFLLIDGLNGGSTDPDHLGWFEIDSAQFGAGIAVADGVTGDPTFSELTVTLAGVAPDILTALAAGTTLGSVQIQQVDNSGNVIYDLILGDAVISGESLSAVSGPPGNSLSFAYERFGLTTPDSSFGYDRTTHSAIDPSTIPTPVVGGTDGLEESGAVRYFMTVEGYNGGSLVSGALGAFELGSIEVSAGLGTTISTGDITTSEPSFSEFVVTLQGMSPELMAELVASDRLGAVHIQGIDPNGDTVYDVRLEDVAFSGENYSTGGGTPSASMSLNYLRIGIITPDDSFGYDVEHHTAIDANSMSVAVPSATSGLETEPAVDYFLIIDSSVTGETGKSYISIELSSIQFGAGIGIALNQRSDPSFSDVTVTFDGVAPNLLAFLASGNQVGPVRLAGVNSSGDIVYDILLEGAHVTSENLGANTGFSSSVSFDFSSIGLITTPSSFGYDVDNLVSIDPTSLTAPPDPVTSLIPSGAVQFFMMIDGLDGGTDTDTGKGWFEISSVELGASEQSVGADFSEVSVTLNGVSPTLFGDLATGTDFSSVMIQAVDGKGAVVYEMRLSDVLVSGTSTSGTAGAVVSSISFAYDQIGLITPNGDVGYDTSSQELVDPLAIATPTSDGGIDIGPGNVEQFYLLVDGFNGGSQDAGFEGWFAIDSVQFSGAVHILNGVPVADPDFSDVSVSMSGISPDLLAELATGDGVGSVRIAGVNASGDIIYDLRLGNANITGDSYNADNGQISSSLAIGYTQVGLITPGSSFGYDEQAGVIDPTQINPVVGGTPPPAEARSAVSYFLWVDGVEGDSAASGYQGWFTLDSFNLSAATAVTPDGVQINPVFSEISATLSTISPDLLAAMANGQNIPGVRIAGVDPEGHQVFDLRLGDVFITGDSFSSGGFSFGTSLNFTYDQFGLITPAASFGYEVSTDSEINPAEIAPMSNSPTPPDAMDDSYTTDEDSVVTVPAATGVLANDVPASAGDVLTVVSYDATSSLGGNVSVGSDGDFVYDPTGSATLQALNTGDSLVDTFTYTVMDQDGETDTATVSITVNGVDDTSNQGPDAVDDTATLNQDTAVSIDVLANDSDPENDPLSVTQIAGSNVLPGDSVDVGNAMVMLNADGTLTYTPDAGFSGDDSFTYTISDGNGGSDSATVDVDVVASPVTGYNPIVATGFVEILRGTGAPDAFIFGPGTSVNGAVDTVMGMSSTDVIDLTSLGLNPEDLEVRLLSGGTILKLIEGFGAGDFQLKIVLGDLTPEQVLASIIYSGGSAGDNQPPVAEDDNVVTPAGTPVQFNVLTNDFDPDGDAISLSTVGAPQFGVLTDLGNGQFEYAPNAGYSGPDSFTYMISDTGGETDTASVYINVLGDTAGDYNPIYATSSLDYLHGTGAPDAFIFDEGTSVTGRIDVVFDMSADDIIDLSELGLNPGDLEVRLISGGTIMKLIEGFDAGDFQLKIVLGDLTPEQVLASIVYSSGAPAGQALVESASVASSMMIEPVLKVPVQELGVSADADTIALPGFHSDANFETTFGTTDFDSLVVKGVPGSSGGGPLDGSALPMLDWLSGTVPLFENHATHHLAGAMPAAILATDEPAFWNADDPDLITHHDGWWAS